MSEKKHNKKLINITYIVLYSAIPFLIILINKIGFEKWDLLVKIFAIQFYLIFVEYFIKFIFNIKIK